MTTGHGSPGDPELVAAVDEALDELVGATPSELVAERPAVRDPDPEREAMAPVRRLRERGYGLP